MPAHRALPMPPLKNGRPVLPEHSTVNVTSWRGRDLISASVSAVGFLTKSGPTTTSSIAICDAFFQAHRCLHHRFANSGKLEPWPLVREGREIRIDLPIATAASTLEPLIYLAERAFGITCLPSFAVASEIAQGKLVSLLDDYVADAGTFRVLRPTNRYLSPKVRAFVDYMSANLFAR